ncbi:MAG: ABC transporter substrate-binding protein [Pseudomonadota bacterium]
MQPSSLNYQYLRRTIAGPIFLAFMIVSAQALPQTDPREVVELTVNSILLTLQDSNLDQAKKKHQITEIASRHFDFEAMTSRVLATNWKRATTADQRRITQLFKQMLIETYWQKMSRYSDEQVEFLQEQSRSEEYVSCPTLIRTNANLIPVDYKLYRVGNTWMAYDVVIEQVSLVRNYRGKFQSIVRDDGIPGLISHLESQNEASP